MSNDSTSVSNYYIGLDIQEDDGLHATLAYIKDATTETVEDVLAIVKTHLGEAPFTGTSLLLDGRDMFGPKKDILVRLLHFSDSDDGRLIRGLANELYAKYGNKDYPQNFHISSGGKPDEEVTFKPKQVAVNGWRIYVKNLSTKLDVFSSPEKKH